MEGNEERSDGDYGLAILFARPGQVNQSHIANLAVKSS